MANYVVTLVFDNGTNEKRFTDSNNLDKVVNSTLSENFYVKKLKEVYVNEAYYCFDGYLTTGDYVRQVL